MTSEEFVTALDEENRVLLGELGKRSGDGEAPANLSVAQLLKVALRNELEASELAALWMIDTPELDAKLALARQCGDEARHYHLIEERLEALGETRVDFNPQGSPSALGGWLKTLRNTVERAAAGQFTREAIAVTRNEIFAAFCEERGDAATAALYRERIQPDERHHHELGRRLLLKYAVTDEAQAQARAAARRTIEIAEEVQELARLQAGISRAPGC